jgi:hypothetical protein
MRLMHLDLQFDTIQYKHPDLRAEGADLGGFDAQIMTMSTAASCATAPPKAVPCLRICLDRGGVLN